MVVLQIFPSTNLILIFNRNRAALQLSGMVGENSTWGEEVVISGLYDKVSVSVGQYHFETDGFRKNAFLWDNIYDFFIQASLTPSTSVQGEFRYRYLKGGDLGLRYFRG